MDKTGGTVLADAFIDEADGASRLLRQALVVAASVLFITAAAHIRIPMWPVPVTMQTFAILTVGAACGPALAGAALVAYLGLGALGVAVFTGNAQAQAGLDYMMGPTGGYLVGFLLASVAVGWLARRGWDRSTVRLAAALLVGNVIIYACGLPWMASLFGAEKGMDWVIRWGLVNFFPGDLLKLALAVAILPMVRKAVL